MGRRSLLDEMSLITPRYLVNPFRLPLDKASDYLIMVLYLAYTVHTVSGDCWSPEEAYIWRMALGTQWGLLISSPNSIAHVTGIWLSFFVVTDAELSGVHVPWLGASEGIQHEPHHTQALAGKVCYDAHEIQTDIKSKGVTGRVSALWPRLQIDNQKVL